MPRVLKGLHWRVNGQIGGPKKDMQLINKVDWPCLSPLLSAPAAGASPPWSAAPSSPPSWTATCNRHGNIQKKKKTTLIQGYIFIASCKVLSVLKKYNYNCCIMMRKSDTTCLSSISNLHKKPSKAIKQQLTFNELSTNRKWSQDWN